MKAGVEFDEELASENISNILTSQKQKEKEDKLLDSLFS